MLPDAKVTFDHNPNDVANREFKFKNIASPAKDDAAANAKLTLIDGDLDQGGAELSALTMAACRGMKTNRAQTFSSGPEAPVAASAWTSAAPIEVSRRSIHIHGIQTRVAHSCTNFTPPTDPIRSSISIRSVELIRQLLAGS